MVGRRGIEAANLYIRCTLDHDLENDPCQHLKTCWIIETGRISTFGMCWKNAIVID
jgi:hypothetical protein